MLSPYDATINSTGARPQMLVWLALGVMPEPPSRSWGPSPTIQATLLHAKYILVGLWVTGLLADEPRDVDKGAPQRLRLECPHILSSQGRAGLSQGREGSRAGRALCQLPGREVSSR